MVVSHSCCGYTYTEEQQRDCIAEMGDNVRVPVSYTHLDVYKRQVLHSPVPFKKEFIESKFIAPLQEVLHNLTGDPITIVVVTLSLIHISFRG